MKNNKNLVNLNKKVTLNNGRIFFGEYNGFQRYDVYKNIFFKHMERAMRQAFWSPEEISLIADRENFKNLPKHIQEILIHNLLFQTLMDSGQNRGLDSVLAQIVTESEVEAVFKTQAFFELIHSLSYSHIIREMFSTNASEIFDRVYQIPEIKKRIDREIDAYDEIHQLFKQDKLINNDENKKKILTLLLYIYFLEGLKFYISFMITYLINSSYSDSIPGVTKIIKLINFDEDMHVGVVSGLINILRKDKSEGFSHLFNDGWFESQAYKIVDTIVKDEIEWGEFLLSIGIIPSLNTEVIKNFIQYYANDRLEKIKLDPKYKEIKDLEIITWFQFYKDINKDNTAQQEAQALNYNIGLMVDDIGNIDLNVEFNKLKNAKKKR